MSDANSPRRPKHGAPQPSDVRFTARQKPLPPQPRPIAKDVDFADDLPDLRLRMPGGALRTPGAPPLRDDRQEAPQPRRDVYPPIAETQANLNRARLMSARAAPARSFLPDHGPGRSLLGRFWSNPLLMLLAGAACFVIFVWFSAPSRTVISSYPAGSSAPASLTEGVVQQIVNFISPRSPVVAQALPGQHSILGPPTISARDVEAVLRQYGSPALGAGGQVWIDKGLKYGIDPAYALAFFVQESTVGTNPGWAGLKPGGDSTHNVGNIICAGYATCYNRFRDYRSWDEGIEDWYKLIADEYVAGRGAQMVEQIVPIYAPAFENDVDAYINTVVNLVDGWRRQGVGR